MYEIRDPIHKSIEFNDFEKAIIDHPYFARLRKIGQLGLAQLVYPGATHNRFIHALGVMHVAGRIWQRLSETSNEIFKKFFTRDDLVYLGEIVRLAALLHDVGHGPFSHAVENLMPPLKNLSIPASWHRKPPGSLQAKHEDYSVMLIYEIAKSGETPMDLSTAQDIAALVNHRFKPSARFAKRFQKVGAYKMLKAIISGELDADRMDYLLRDAYFAGVAYGHYDMDWLINNLQVAQVDHDLVLTINEAGVRAFEDYLLARYHMFLQVYFHKTVSCFEHYLEAIFRAKEINYSIPADARSYAKLTDATILEAIHEAGQTGSNYWSRHLDKRVPAKRLLRANYDDLPRLKKFQKILEKNKIRFFTRTSEQSLSSLPVVSTGKKTDSSLLVTIKFLGESKSVPMEEYSELIKTYNKKIYCADLFIYREDWKKAEKIFSRLRTI